MQQSAIAAGGTRRGIPIARRGSGTQQQKAQLQNQLMDKRTQAAAIRSRFSPQRNSRGQQRKAVRARAHRRCNREDFQSASRRTGEAKRPRPEASEDVREFDGAQLAVQQATVDEKRALYDLKKSQMDQLRSAGHRRRAAGTRRGRRSESRTGNGARPSGATNAAKGGAARSRKHRRRIFRSARRLRSTRTTA